MEATIRRRNAASERIALGRPKGYGGVSRVEGIRVPRRFQLTISDGIVILDSP